MNKNKLFIKSLSGNTFFKLVSVLLSFIYVPILLEYLSPSQYGLWMTILSIVTWIYIFDLGLGNGLKVNLAESLAKGKVKLAREYISTTYFIIVIISASILVLGLGLYNIDLDYSKWFTGTQESNEELKDILSVVFVFAIFNFILSLYKQILFSLFKMQYIAVAESAIQVLNIVFVLILKFSFEKSVLFVAIAHGSSILIISVAMTLVIFRINRELIPSLKHVQLSKVREVFDVGVKFLAIQLSAVIIYSTDSLIISRYLSVTEVVPYSIALKVYSGLLIIWYLFTGPLTPLYTNAYVNKDYDWIKSSIKKMNFIFLMFCVLVIFVFLSFDHLVYFWIGDNVAVDKPLLALFSLFVLIRMYGDLYMSFLNAIKVLNLQVFLSVLGAVVNIPLSIYLIKVQGFGSEGVILATCISLLPLGLCMPLQSIFKLRVCDR